MKSVVKIKILLGRWLHLPGLLLIGLCALVCELFCWNAGCDWCEARAEELVDKCRKPK